MFSYFWRWRHGQRPSIRRPLLARGHQAGRRQLQSLIISLFNYLSAITYHNSFQDLSHYMSAIGQSSIYWFAGQQSVVCTSLLVPPGTRVRPPSLRVLSALGGSGETLKFIKISMPVQWPHKSSNWCPKTLQSDQNDVQTATWSRSNQQKVRKLKSNENHYF